jgi:hypothetical protein
MGIGIGSFGSCLERQSCPSMFRDARTRTRTIDLMRTSRLLLDRQERVGERAAKDASRSEERAVEFLSRRTELGNSGWIGSKRLGRGDRGRRWQREKLVFLPATKTAVPSRGGCNTWKDEGADAEHSGVFCTDAGSRPRYLVSSAAIPKDATTVK